MRRTNLQVRINPETEVQIEKLSSGSKSDFVRKAIEEKVRREEFRRLEEQWIGALMAHPQEKRTDRDWLKAETWGAR